ncbi:hypothetical protein [Rhizobium halophilum]|uniref:hypothetical protein n=1 Tax=Rhizobium halophilum TaxID=2846852 RepID=UPI001EFE894C|nr:hypothetical protein [Rhizobium halophilum]MCF6368138.1 hypothetical protein [Rhizobium halophilum]
MVNRRRHSAFILDLKRSLASYGDTNRLEELKLKMMTSCWTRRPKRWRSSAMQAAMAAGELDTELKKQKLLEAYAEELEAKRKDWKNLQVSVVAGAGFEPAAFRL